MKHILVIGAGRSSSSLIRYLLGHAAREKWTVTIGDVSLPLAEAKAGGHPAARAIAFDINNARQRQEEIAKADIVVSMLPASMHIQVAKDCLKLKKHLATASYVSKEIGAMNREAEKAGLIFLNEAGLDPGIDHMSAMQLIDGFKKAGEEILSFRSYCGGLVAPESNDNPWGYKFSWNPRNVVLAGQGGDAQYLEKGELKTIPYEKLFEQTETIEVSGYGRFEAYANRDSLSYRQPYGLEEIPTLLRGTLRMPGFCRAWNALIRLGLTDDTKSIADSDQLTWEQLIHRLNPVITADLAAQIHGNSEVFSRLEWLGIFSDRKIPLKNATPAQILQELLEEKWALKPHDKDMIVMQHIFETRNKKKEIRKVKSSLVVIGDDQVYTAMAKTVGLPLAICVKLILQGKIKARGVVIPVLKEIYTPVLKELADNGIRFQEKQMN